MAKRIGWVRWAGAPMSAALAICALAACRGAVEGSTDDEDAGSVEAVDGGVSEAGSTDASRDANPSMDGSGNDAALMDDASSDASVGDAQDGGNDSSATFDAGDAAPDATADSGSDAGSGAGTVSLTPICSLNGTFCTYDSLAFGGPVNGAWGAAANDVWASSIEGVLHFDGTQWSRVSSSSYKQIVGTGSADVWAVTGGLFANGATTLAHWDGATWSNVSVGSSFQLAAVWAGAADDVWAVAPTGTAVHFDGVTWSKKSVGTVSDLATVFGFASNDVWIGGLTATMLHYDGNTWTSVNTGLSTDDVNGIWGASSSDMWACTSGGVYHGGLQGWSKVSATPCTSVFGLASNKVAFISSTSKLAQWDGATFSGFAPFFSPATPTSISSVGTELLVSTDDGTSWGSHALFHGPSFTTLQSYTQRFRPFDPALVWSKNGTSYMISATGAFATTTAPGSWKTGGSIGTTKTMDAMFGTSGTDIWAVGPSGIATHYDGNAWSPQSLQAATLTDVWGSAPNDFYTTGGAAYHWDGAMWTALPVTGATVTGTASNDVWIGGASTIQHWDGNAWTSTTLDLVYTGNTIFKMQAFASNDVWLVTTLGDIFHWIGTKWIGGTVTGSNRVDHVFWYASGDAWGSTGNNLWRNGSVAGPGNNEFFGQGQVGGFPFQLMGGPGEVWVWDMELWKHK